MSYTAKDIEAAIAQVLAKRRADVVSSWATEQTAEKRERLWVEHQSIESIEELLRHEFASIIERAAGGEPGPGDRDSGGSE
jgi:hypothetical protein